MEANTTRGPAASGAGEKSSARFLAPGLRAGRRAGRPGPATLTACVISCSARASSPRSCAARDA